MPSLAQEKKSGEGARVIAVSPLPLAWGKKIDIRLRGLKLDSASKVEIKPALPGCEITLGEKKKTTVPNGVEAKQVGDTELEVKLSKLQGEVPAGIELIVETAAGRTSPVQIPVFAGGRVVAEKEDNGGFATAQKLELGAEMQGVIGQEKDVDVFAISGKPESKIAVQLLSGAWPTLLDPLIAVYSVSGTLLSTSDLPGNSLGKMVVTLPTDGRCVISIMDAQDSGSSFHGYLLRVDPVP